MTASVYRRQFLRGAAGVTLALPFLPSLEKRARAGSPPVRKRLFWFGTDHGGAYDTNMFPPTTMLDKQATALAGHTVNAGALKATVAGGVATLSPILSASSSTLTPALIAKMNVLRGLDVPWYIAHNTGLHLGDFARNDNNGGDGAAVTQLGHRPTVDQIIAGSSSFYSSSDLASTTQRAMVINPGRAISWAFTNPAQGAQSGVQNVQGVGSSLQLFNAVFPQASGSMQRKRPLIVDQVYANYQSLSQGNTRLSALDKQRLNTHMQMLLQLEQSLKATVSCTTPPKPGEDASSYAGKQDHASSAKEGQLWADVVAAAFSCGASRVGAFGWGDTSALADFSGDWHQSVAHQWMIPSQQQLLATSYQRFFENVFVYLAAKLDQLDDGDGSTVLDNTLLGWSQECCMSTHDSYSIPVITFGGAGGYFNTGLYCDYRKMGEASALITPNAQYIPDYTTYLGLLYNQWLANVLLAMGIPNKEFELWQSQGKTEKGYGTPFLATAGWEGPYAQHYYPGHTADDVAKSQPDFESLAYFQMASNPLPFLVKG